MQKWIFSRLASLEQFANRLPHPTLLFVWLSLGVLILSAIASALDWSAKHPVTGTLIVVDNLLDGDGIRKVFTQMVSNFTGFAPLGPVLVAMLGLGIAERSGLLGAILKRLVSATRGRGISIIVVFAGVLSSIAADAGYVVLIPLAAVVFQTAGKPPIAGIAAAFMGVSGGYSANLLVGPVDVVLAGLSTEAAQLYQSDYEVSVTANYYFMLVSTLFISLLGAAVTERWIIPYLSTSKAGHTDITRDDTLSLSEDHQQTASEDEKKGMRSAGWVTLVCIALIAAVALPSGAPLRDPATGDLLRSPFVSSIVVSITLMFAVAGIAYGRAAGTLSNQSSIIHAMEETMATMAGYLVLMFFAAQFVAYFGWTQLGLIFAINGAEFLSTLEIPHSLLLILLLLLVATVNLTIGSASAKWALLAPVFVPMFMVLGVSPEWTQLTYRIGDSATNIITPLMPYFALVVAYVQRYEPESGLGTLIAVMLPYSLALLLGWSALLLIWSLTGLPIGPS